MTVQSEVAQGLTLLVASLLLALGLARTALAADAPAPAPARGPLRLLPANHRYFTDGTGKAILLTGSHTWGNLQDYTYDTKPSPPATDFAAYLAFLQQHHHNCFRLWAWETAANRGAKAGNITYSPSPYQRPGPALALDGQPQFDLAAFNQSYFDRLRTRTLAARDAGIYTIVMLFNGFSIEGKGNVGGDAWIGHPLNPRNNLQGLDGGARGAVHTLANPAAVARQEAYVRKVIDTGGPDNTAWQIHMIQFIQQVEAAKPKQHPVGMTVQYPKGDDAALAASPATWISPAAKLPAADGRKVILNDTDHSYFWIGLKQDGVPAQRAWVWENFTRGHQCLFMDPYLDPSHDPGRNAPAGGKPDPYWDPLRDALGRTRDYADRMNLAAMTPHGELASTGFCLANPGKEYLLYLPKGGDATVDLSAAPGDFTVEWLDAAKGTITPGGALTGGAKRTCTAPFVGDAVVYLVRK